MSLASNLVSLTSVGESECIRFSTPSREHSNEMVPHNPISLSLSLFRFLLCRRDFIYFSFSYCSVEYRRAKVPVQTVFVIGSREL